MMVNSIDYRDDAKKWEKEFRTILAYFEFYNKTVDMSIDEIYEEYTEGGNRMGRETILGFQYADEPNDKEINGTFLFGRKNVAPLSGGGWVSYIRILDDGEIEFVRDKVSWRH